MIELGIGIQENIAVFSQNKPECLYVDFGAFGVRAVTVPFYATSSEAQVHYMVGDAEIRYIFVGGMTTLVNYSVYYVLLKLNAHWLIANSVSWLGAVLFAYYTNKKYVFKSSNESKKEFVSFVLLRLVTLLVETGCLSLLIDLLHIQPMISKIVVSFITIISNYVLCKFKVFKKEGVYCG